MCRRPAHRTERAAKMAKRGADKELTHDNWAEEEEPEEMGTFRQASSEQLATRQIKKAKRRGIGVDNQTGIFKGLEGFSTFGGGKDSVSKPSFSFLSTSSANSSSVKPTFSFTTTNPNTSSSIEKSDGDKPASQPFKITQDSNPVATKALEPVKTNGLNPSTSPNQPPKSSTSTSGSKVFLAHLKALNEGVLHWVKQHLDKNPHVNLSPVFDDYKKHFEEMNKKYPLATESEGDSEAVSKEKKDKVCEKENKPLSTESQEKEKAPSSSTSLVTTSSDKTVETSPSKPLFSFGSAAKSQDMEKDGNPKATFTGFDASKKDSVGLIFGGSLDGSSPKKGFTFGFTPSSTGFTFPTTTTATTTSSASSATNSEDTKKAEDPSDEPPPVQVNEVKEEDALYEKKCKLYYQKDNEYVDRGVGTLFLKPAGEKTQLLIRAYTNLGNILLNIVLNSSIPTVRAGKNGIIIACVPNPPLEAKSSSTDPVKMLIKVKTAEDADILLEKINEYKK